MRGEREKRYLRVRTDSLEIVMYAMLPSHDGSRQGREWAHPMGAAKRLQAFVRTKK